MTTNKNQVHTILLYKINSSSFKWLAHYFHSWLMGKDPKLKMSTGPWLGCYATAWRQFFEVFSNQMNIQCLSRDAAATAVIRDHCGQSHRQ